MKFLRKASGLLSPLLIAVMLYTALPVSPVLAGIVTTDDLISAQGVADNRDKVSAFLARGDVRRHLESMGVDPANVDNRLAALSDSEVNYLAGQIDQMPAGQGALGLIIVVGLVVLIVLLITDIAGVTNVFSFVNKPSQR